MPPEIFLANASGAVTGTHTVAATTAPVRSAAAIARGNWMWIVFSGILIGSILYLETFDNEEVNQAIKKWGDAARLLGSDQFGAAIAAVPPSDNEWDFDDRDAFDLFMRKLGAEINSLAEAFNANKDTLTSARDAYNDAVSGMAQALMPILVAVVASIAFQFFPATTPLAQAIGIAGLTAASAILVLVFGNIGALLHALAAAFNTSGRFSFVSDSRPGWAPTGSDPDIKDIKIDWVKDAKFYQ
ncbi:hypothetical protein ACNAW0_14940 [Micromonospora sp. SL1-18]|uniref:hypothetical protein n=1 Tax=Micromonospora sp. SL1-18 TaxID=3399128 RepID=UPI003A4E455E